jgi:alpha-D-xyloside xylohydrolase
MAIGIAVGCPAFPQSALEIGKVRITPISRNIFRIQRFGDSDSEIDPLPAIVGVFPKPRSRIVRGVGYREIRTSLMSARIFSDGDIAFYDRAGSLLTTEPASSRRLQRFELPKFPGVEAYHASASFAYRGDEHLYGLGQHQDGALDRRGTRTILSQDNREVAIPWVASTKGYGIFWNNASRTVVDAAGPLDLNELVDSSGKAGGLTGQYFNGRNFEKLNFSRRDAGIDFDWTLSPPPGLGHDDYSVRWTGTFVARAAGAYRFQASADDGVRLFIDGKPLLNDWSVHPARPVAASVNLSANSRHTIRLEFFQATRDSLIHFSWSTPGPGSVRWSSYAAKAIDYYVVADPSMNGLLADLRNLTGHAPMPPIWALGYWQSKERYATQKEWIDIAEGYRSRKLPIDNIVQDWFYWDPHPWGSHLFDRKRYPDPAAGISELHDRYHLHFMISVWGKFAPGTPDNPDSNYDQLLHQGSLYPPDVSSPERYYDAFSAKARATYWDQIRREIFNKGVDAWWLDASEPEANLTALDSTMTGMGPGAFVVSGWPLMHTAGVYQGQRAANPKKRVFILTRSAYAGQQRNGAATWSGDITANWETLANQVPAGLNIGVSGIPYWTTDIGAFFVPYPGGCDNPEYRELYTRWFEFGAFCPIFRSHGTSTPREMWRFGPKIQTILAKYDKIRYRLAPYLYSQAWQATSHGATLMRPLAAEFQHDDSACEVADQFMFGPNLMICPVTKPAVTHRRVYLPAGTLWTDFWSGKSSPGGQWVDAEAPLQQEPIYVRAGSIVPMGPEIQYMGERPEAPIELRLTRGGKSTFDLYEDSGDGYGYEQGAHSEIPLEWDGTRRVLTIGARRGTFPGMEKSRVFRLVLVSPGYGVGEEIAKHWTTTVRYSGFKTRVTLK